MYDYYGVPGVRELCHQIKNGIVPEKVMDEMASWVNEGVLVPIPSHTGIPTYTETLAKGISRRTGLKVYPVLTSNPHEPLYYNRDAELYMTTAWNKAMAIKLVTAKPKKVYLLDNVISTGKTFDTAKECLVNELGIQREIIFPLVYAIERRSYERLHVRT